MPDDRARPNVIPAKRAMDGRVPLPKAALLAPFDRERCNRSRDQTNALNVASTHVSRVLVCVSFQLGADSGHPVLSLLADPTG
jgi:hypothetical protein